MSREKEGVWILVIKGKRDKKSIESERTSDCEGRMEEREDEAKRGDCDTERYVVTESKRLIHLTCCIWSHELHSNDGIFKILHIFFQAALFRRHKLSSSLHNVDHSRGQHIEEIMRLAQLDN